MRLNIISDLHMEFDEYKYDLPESDVLVLAGDICNDAWIEKPNVIHVPGNHEYYGRKLKTYNEVKIIGSVRFLCSTLWTDFNLHGDQPLGMFVALRGMEDYNCILGLKPADTLKEHVKSLDFLRTNLEIPFSGKTIVVTHHAPSPNSIHSKYEGNQLNPAFASDLDDFILKYQPAMWIHGHVHDSFDYKIGETSIVCNPKGYYDENPNFDPYLIKEV